MKNLNYLPKPLVGANIIEDFLMNTVSEEARAIGLAIGFVSMIFAFILLTFGGNKVQDAKTRILCVMIGVCGVTMAPGIFAFLKGLG